MRKLPFLTIFFIVSTALYAKGIEIVTEDNFQVVTKPAAEYETVLHNKSGSNWTIWAFKEKLSYPDGWEHSFCVGPCLPPDMDTTDQMPLPTGDSIYYAYHITAVKETPGFAFGKMTLIETTTQDTIRNYFGAYYNPNAKSPSVEMTSAEISENRREVTIKNSGTKALTLKGALTPVELPQNWKASFSEKRADSLSLPTIQPNSSTTVTVNFVTPSVGTGAVFLALVDQSGNSFTGTILACTRKSTPIIQVPSSSIAQRAGFSGSIIHAGFLYTGLATVSVYSMSGRLVEKEVVPMQNGAAFYGSVTPLSAGLYLMRLTCGTQAVTIPILKN